MKWVIYILKKQLANEKKWLSYKSMVASGDPKIREGVRMAKERVPQLEQALNLLTNPKATSKFRKSKIEIISPKQLQLWKSSPTKS